MYPGKGVECRNSYGHVYAGNSKFLLDNNICVDVDTQLDKLKNEGKASILVALNGKVIGLIGLSDVIREDSKQMIERLHDLNVETILLTGDNTKTANYFASQVGIKKVYGNLLPEEKLTWIEKLKKEDKKVCMIGDGVNDAPALKAADVSVAMGSIGSDVAIEASDLVIMGDDLAKITVAINISKYTKKIIKQNLIFAMTVKILILLLSILGFANMWMAVFADTGVTLLTIINTLRILKKFR